MKVYSARVAESNRNVIVSAVGMIEAISKVEDWLKVQKHNWLMLYSMNYLGDAFLPDSEMPNLFLNGKTAYRCTYSLVGENHIEHRTSRTKIFFCTGCLGDAWELMNTAIRAQHFKKYNELGEETFTKKLNITSLTNIGNTILS